MLQTRKGFGNCWNLILAICTVLCSLYSPVDSAGAVVLTNDNFDSLASQHEIVFINFYADWCRFSQILGPVFDEAADKLAKEITTSGKVLMGKVDCDKETSLATRFHISKYPTLKMVRNSQVAKREYRGQRSADAMVTHVKEQIQDPVEAIATLENLDSFEASRRTHIAIFDRKDSPQYEIFRKVATNLRDDCKFHLAEGAPFNERKPNGDTIIFKLPKSKNNADKVYGGNLLSYPELNDWITYNCLPMVREITFENAEELTEEGLPFLILFHHPDDTATIEKFTQFVQVQLASEKSTINILTADGIKFAHPLHHLGKTEKDLPLIAIDSFKHMYLFPKYEDMNIPGRLKQFIDDLYSGKLHREFHYGPDPVANEIEQQIDPVQGKIDTKSPTTPPESTFKKLGPSRNRYTLLRDEL